MPIIKTPTQARSEIYELINNVNKNSKPIFISGKSQNKGAVLISKKDYDAQQETIVLLLNGQIKDAIKRDKEPKNNEIDAFKMIKNIKKHQNPFNIPGINRKSYVKVMESNHMPLDQW